MIEALFNDPNYLAAKKMLDVTTLRQEAIAANLANLETPNYKRVDIATSFESQLQEAIAGRNGDQITGLQPQITTDTTAISSRSDGNTVQIEDELLKMNKNGMDDALETQLISGQLANIKMAFLGHA